MKVTYLGTTVLLFDDGKDQILVDCHVTRPSLLKFALSKLDSDQEIVDRVLKEHPMERLRAIFISHCHHDHILDMPSFMKKSEAELYGASSALMFAKGEGIEESRLHNFEDLKPISVGDFNVTVIPSLHSKPNFFNNDLGQKIEEPFKLPASRKYFKEGGSFDFVIRHGEKTYLIRPSYNYIPHQLDGIKADVLFLGVAGLYQDEAERKTEFFKETVDKVKPSLVLPLHWDNFFIPLFGPSKTFRKSKESMELLEEYCQKNSIAYKCLMPLEAMEDL